MSAETVRSGRGRHAVADGGRGGATLQIDGAEPLTTESVAAVEAACSAAESDPSVTVLTVEVTGAPAKDWTHGLDVALVSKWERSLRRLERLDVTTVTVATGDCGGLALDVLLATDYRIATADVRLLLHLAGDATWPGMALFRLAQQSGGTRARRAILFGAHLDAHASVDLGLVDEVTDDPAEALVAATEMVSGLSGRELAIRRQLMFDAATISFDDALGRHLAACDRALRRSAVTGTP